MFCVHFGEAQEWMEEVYAKRRSARHWPDGGIRYSCEGRYGNGAAIRVVE